MIKNSTYHSYLRFITTTFIFLIIGQIAIYSQELKLGKQIWAEKNLNVTVFRNGDTIPHVRSEKEWIEAINNKQPAWCYYNNDPELGEKFGKLYNWYAVNDPRGLAPEEWEIPTVNDFAKLIEFYGGSKRMLENTDTIHYTKQLKKLKRKFKKTKNDSLFITMHDEFYDSTLTLKKIIPSEPEMIIRLGQKINRSTIQKIEEADIGDVIGPFINGKRISLIKVTDFKETDFATVQSIYLSVKDKADFPKMKVKADSIVEVIKENDNFEEMIKLFSEDPTSSENKGVYSDFQRGEMIPQFNDYTFENPVGSIGVVSAENGLHIIEVLHKYTEERPEVIYLRKEMRPGQSIATKMKHKKHWEYYPSHGDSKNSFKALPAGQRSVNGMFFGKGIQTIFWLKSTTKDNSFQYLGLMSQVDEVIVNVTDEPAGLSVRCIKIQN